MRKLFERRLPAELMPSYIAARISPVKKYYKIIIKKSDYHSQCRTNS